MRLIFVFAIILSSADFIIISPTKVANPEAIIRVPIVKCSEISPETGEDGSEGASCTRLCKSIRKTFAGGECLTGICNCRLDVGDVILSVRAKAGDNATRAPISEEEGNDEKTPKGDVGSERKAREGVKCKNLIRLGRKGGGENHKGCKVHCRLLSPDNKDGRCVDGTCQCSKKTPEATTRAAESDSGRNGERPTPKTPKGTTNDRGSPPGESEDETEDDSDVGCGKTSSRCTTHPAREDPLLHEEGLHQIPDNVINRHVSKCDSEARDVSDDKCRAECEAFSRDHKEGRCIGGICHCGYAVFEDAASDLPKSGTTEDVSHKNKGTGEDATAKRIRNRQRARGPGSRRQ